MEDSTDSENLCMFHLRVTIGEDKDKFTLTSFNLFLKKFKPVMYIMAYEEVGETNKHIHAHIEYANEPKRQTMSDFMKKEGYAGKYYHTKVKTTKEKNLLYCIKDMDILATSLTDEELEEWKSKTEKINDEKTKPMKQQLYEVCLDRFIAPPHRVDLVTLIFDYMKERDYMPPTPSLMKQYIMYLTDKTTDYYLSQIKEGEEYIFETEDQPAEHTEECSIWTTDDNCNCVITYAKKTKKILKSHLWERRRRKVRMEYLGLF